MSMNYEKIEIAFVSFPTNCNKISKNSQVLYQLEFFFCGGAGAILVTKISDYTYVNEGL